MSDSFLGQIVAVGFNFAPPGWMPCDGRTLPIAQYGALYALLSTTYGGNGHTDFGLPDLRGRLAVCQGQGPGLSDYALGVSGGAEAVTLRSSQIGAHTHTLMATTNTDVSKASPHPVVTNVLSDNTQTVVNMYNPGPPDTSLSPLSIKPTTGGGSPHENRQPFLAINYIICVEGIFPSHG